MIGRDDDPLVPRRKPFEIDGDWGEPSTLKYDRKSIEEIGETHSEVSPKREVPQERPTSRLDTSGGSSLEERIAYLERMNALVWKVIHEIQGKKPPEDPEER